MLRFLNGFGETIEQVKRLFFNISKNGVNGFFFQNLKYIIAKNCNKMSGLQFFKSLLNILRDFYTNIGRRRKKNTEREENNSSEFEIQRIT